MRSYTCLNPTGLITFHCFVTCGLTIISYVRFPPSGTMNNFPVFLLINGEAGPAHASALRS